MAEDKTARGSSRPADTSRDAAELSDDISRIVSFLDSRRTETSERAAGLAHELAHRREAAPETWGSPARGAMPEAAENAAIPETAYRGAPVQITNRDLAVRYHSFCQELDELMDGFRARVSRSKPVQH